MTNTTEYVTRPRAVHTSVVKKSVAASTSLHLAVMTATLCGPGGVRAVIGEHLLLKQPLIVLRRSRQQAPHLIASDRRLFGFGSLFFSPGRIRKVAIGRRFESCEFSST